MAEFPMTESARRGRDLFFSDRTRCAVCHVGPNFTDEQYHALGLPAINAESAGDTGRFAVSGREEDRGAYRTPTLRNVAQTPPYMHAGQLETLEEVVAWFNRLKPGQSHVSPLVQSSPGLTAAEQGDLVEFLRSLTGALPPVAEGRLPE
jgi:cytochrome c peroxidase